MKNKIFKSITSSTDVGQNCTFAHLHICKSEKTNFAKFANFATGYFARVAAVLLMLVTLGVGEMWGIDYGDSEVTFHAGDKLYFDFTAYSLGVDMLNAQGNLSYQGNTSKIIEVTFSQNVTLNSNKVIFQSAATNWNTNAVKCTKFPTSGQNMIISTDGQTWEWGTYSAAPAPEPEPEVDPAIDGCDGCFLVTEVTE